VGGPAWPRRVIAVQAPDQSGDDESRPRRVVRIGPRATRAYRASDVARIYETLGETRAGAAALRRLDPLCDVAADRVFVTRAPYQGPWAAVTCGDEPALVPLTDTLFLTIVRRHGREIRLYQIVRVMCDMPSIDEWLYDVRAGRRPIPGATYLPGPLDDPAAGGGCGGRS
jgi:hypothetical protein